jgi:hypothetical protein
MGPFPHHEGRKTMKIAANRVSSATNSRFRTGSMATSASGSFQVVSGRRATTVRSPASKKRIEDAVYGYLQAVRALGKTQVNSSEIARALGLSVSQVDEILPKLSAKGVRLAG